MLNFELRKKFALDTPIKERSLFEYYRFTKRDEKEYPVISGILKKLTPERIKKEIEAVQKVKLPPELQKWVEEYEKVGGRNEFIWKWIYKGDKVIIESFNILRKYCDSVIETIFLFHMFTNLIDDISEKYKEENLLSELLKIPFNQDYINFNQLDKRRKGYLMFIIKVWHKIERNFREYPYCKEIQPLFVYDIYQLLNTTKYSFLIYNNPYFINKTEYSLYLFQNMQLIFVFDLCLMCSKFSFKDLGKLREIILYAQQMLRIGNDIATWEREMENNDFANAICVYSIDSGLITIDELKKERKLKSIKKIRNAKVEQVILEEWKNIYQKIKKFDKKNAAIDRKKLLSAIEKITFYYLVAKGHI